MRTTRIHHRLAIALLVPVALVAASCGSDKTATTTPSAATTSASTAPASTAVGSSAGSAAPTDSAGSALPTESMGTAASGSSAPGAGSSTPTGTDATKPVTIRFASIESAGQSEVPKVMTESGIAATHHLDVKVVPYAQPGAQYNLIKGGEADVVAGNVLDLQRLRNSGSKIKAFWGFQGWSNQIVVLPNSPIKTFSDLKGKKVGEFGATFFDWLVLRGAGKAAFGFDIEKDAKPTQAAPPLLNQALAKGEVDAALQFSSFTLAPIVNGEQRVVTTVRDVIVAANLNPESMYLVWMVTEDWLDKNPNGLADLQAAMADTYQVLKNDDTVWDKLVPLVGITDPTIAKAFIAEEREITNPPFSADLLAPTQQLIDAISGVVGPDVIGFDKLDPASFAFPAA